MNDLDLNPYCIMYNTNRNIYIQISTKVPDLWSFGPGYQLLFLKKDYIASSLGAELKSGIPRNNLGISL